MQSASLDTKAFLAGMLAASVIAGIAAWWWQPTPTESILRVEPTDSLGCACEQASSNDSYSTSEISHSDSFNSGSSSSFEGTENEAVLSQHSVKQGLLHGLSEQTLLGFDEYPVTRLDSELAADTDLQRQVLDKIQSESWSTSRSYWLALIAGLPHDLKEQAANELLTSERLIDKQGAVALLMDIDDANTKAFAVENIVANTSNAEVLAPMLEYLQLDSSLAESSQVSDALQQLYRSHADERVKQLALQAYTPSSQLSDDMYQEILALVTDNTPANTLTGLDAVNSWVVENVDVITDQQKADLAAQANSVAESRAYSIELRMKALELLQNIQ